MSFFKKLIDKKDLQEHSGFNFESEDLSDKDLEMLYLKLYMKIGRDFVLRKDYENDMSELVAYLDLSSEDIGYETIEEAISLAYDYKDIIEQNRMSTYKDLIDLNE